jgi:glutathione S-transferase
LTGRLTHADIAVAAVLRHLGEADPGLVDPAAFPALARHAAALEETAAFRAVSQPFVPPG